MTQWPVVRVRAVHTKGRFVFVCVRGSFWRKEGRRRWISAADDDGSAIYLSLSMHSYRASPLPMLQAALSANLIRFRLRRGGRDRWAGK